MKRSTIILTRIGVFIFAAAFIAVGVLALLWVLESFQRTIDASALGDVESESWWPVALGVAAVLLVALGLRSIMSRARSRTVKQLALPSSSVEGRFDLDAGQLMNAAASSMEEIIGVREVHGQLIKDRGQLVADFDVRIDAAADIEEISQACDAMIASLQAAMERDDIYSRCCLRVARKKDKRRHLVH